MGVSLLSGCSESCGWMAAMIAVIAWGSFGVPLKKSVGNGIEVNPLVMQSYKTLVCFTTSWLVLLLGEELKWSSWGIASGLFWVPGAACGIYGIRNAGLAVAVGTWSSLNVLSSFFFGIVIFQEGVKDFFASFLAFVCLIIGLIGMSRYSAHQSPEEDRPIMSDKSKPAEGPAVTRKSIGKRTQSFTMDTSTNSAAEVHPNGSILPMEIEPLTAHMSAATGTDVFDDEDAIMGGQGVTADASDVNKKDPSHKDRLVFLGGRVSLTRRQLGVLGAVINGAWGGLNLIPLHYALRDDGLTGAGFLISYATGALIVNTSIWILLYAYYLYQKKGQWIEAAECLPKWHLDHLLYPGIMAGLLYSLGNFSSILAVTYLGQGTGFSFCQMQLFVSGLWGVFFFREIKGREIITKWFLSAAVAVIGIIGLSYEHEGGAGMGHRRYLSCAVDSIRQRFTMVPGTYTSNKMS